MRDFWKFVGESRNAGGHMGFIVWNIGIPIYMFLMIWASSYYG